MGGERVKAAVLVPPGASAHSYEPKPGQMAALAKARAYFAVGVEFEEAWLPRLKAANPDILVVPTEAKVERMAMAGKHGHDESGPEARPAAGGDKAPAPGAAQDPHDDHDEAGGPDPHIWLSPKLVILQAEAIAEGLTRLDPAGAPVYAANLARFREECRALDAELRQACQGLAGRAMLVFHPAWAYFARDYGLREVAIEKEGKEPGPKGLKALVAQARAERASVIFVQPQYARKSAETLAREIGARVVAIDPLAEDWAENLRRVAREVGQALR